MFLPRLVDEMGLLLGKKRVGRPTALAGWQKDLRRDWIIFMSKSDAEQKVRRELAVRRSGLKGKAREERLAQIAADLQRMAGTYHTSIETWTCSCPAYLISRFLTCKHLVREAEKKIGSKENDLGFFRNLRRNHHAPYFRIKGIHVIPLPLPAPAPALTSNPGNASRQLSADTVTDDNPEGHHVEEFTEAPEAERVRPPLCLALCLSYLSAF